MNLKDVRNLDRDEILGLLGLERRSPRRAPGWPQRWGRSGSGCWSAPASPSILAPKPGHQLRQELRDRLRRTPDEVNEEAATDGSPKSAGEARA